jgi:16S rRNA (guanine966-N2)-methyltransferase
MSAAKRKRSAPSPKSHQDREIPVGLRIIGGRFRGRKLLYSGDLRTRPMKDRVREAVFNLIGPAAVGKHAIDLFAGTGALGLEALSRGAARATFIEQHFPTADLLRRNFAGLDVEKICTVVTGNTFIWVRRQPELGPVPWIVFCSPPYDFYVERLDEMLTLIGALVQSAPLGSVFVVESDERFQPALLPNPSAWDVRPYLPAVIALCHKPGPEASGA